MHVRCCRVRRAMTASTSIVSLVASASGTVGVRGGRRRRVLGSMRTGTAGRIASRPPPRSPGTGRRLRRVKRRAQRSAASRVRCRVPHPSSTISPGRPSDGVQVHASTHRPCRRANPSAIRCNQRTRAVIALLCAPQPSRGHRVEFDRLISRDRPVVVQEIVDPVARACRSRRVRPQ